MGIVRIMFVKLTFNVREMYARCTVREMYCTKGVREMYARCTVREVYESALYTRGLRVISVGCT